MIVPHDRSESSLAFQHWVVDLGLSIPPSKIWEKTMALGAAAATASATANAGTNGEKVYQYSNLHMSLNYVCIREQ